MVNFKDIQCKFCESFFTPTSSGNKHCCVACRLMEIASKFNGVDGCWEWPLSRNVQTGYGQFVSRVCGKTKMLTAHRVSFDAFNGGIPPGMDVLHSCDNRGCFNPAHLFAGTASDNMLDMYRKGRGRDLSDFTKFGDENWARKNKDKVSRGSNHHSSKINEDIVRFIRTSKLKNAELARKFGVTGSNVSAIRKNKTWAHVS